MLVKLLDSNDCALMSKHKSSIRRKDIHSPLARHFVDAKHSISDLKYRSIQKIFQARGRDNLDQKLLQCESKWIFYLHTVQPEGLNEALGLSCFL